MKRFLIFFLLSLLSITLLFSNSLSEEEKVVESNNLTSIKLLQKIQSSKSEKNVFLSPFSIQTALSIALLGASGKTKEELEKGLNISQPLNEYHSLFSRIYSDIKDKSSDNCIFKSGNRLWIEKKFKVLKSFLESVDKFYRGGVSQLDFINDLNGSVDRINEWVSKETNEMIKKLLSYGDVDSSIRIIITNAIYFKGVWENEFKKENTVKMVFYREDGVKDKVDMMFTYDEFNYFENNTFQALKMNYKCGDFSMVVLLPKKGFKVMDILSKLKGDSLPEILEKMDIAKVSTYIPKFEFEKRYYLKKYLNQLGIVTPFSKDADFSGITGEKDLYIDKVIHQAKIEVNEKGSEAAAATSVSFALTAVAPDLRLKRVVFKADHPFLFFIVDNSSKVIIFEGIFNSPE